MLLQCHATVVLMKCFCNIIFKMKHKLYTATASAVHNPSPHWKIMGWRLRNGNFHLTRKWQTDILYFLLAAKFYVFLCFRWRSSWQHWMVHSLWLKYGDCCGTKLRGIFWIILSNFNQYTSSSEQDSIPGPPKHKTITPAPHARRCVLQRLNNTQSVTPPHR